MPTSNTYPLSMWPLVALHCVVVTERGEALRRARDLRRLSRRQLAEITGVGARTIQRIEQGEASQSARSIEVLEQELAPELRRLSLADGQRALDGFTVNELLAEVSRRYAELEARTQRLPTVTPSDGDDIIEWRTDDAPSGQRHGQNVDRSSQSDGNG